jgi:hypothetical protein
MITAGRVHGFIGSLRFRREADRGLLPLFAAFVPRLACDGDLVDGAPYQL